MPWISRARNKKPHECNLPELHGVVKRSGTVHPAWLADPGDEWACRRCGKVWRVIEEAVFPPGYRGNRSKGSGATIISWELTNMEWR